MRLVGYPSRAVRGDVVVAMDTPYVLGRSAARRSRLATFGETPHRYLQRRRIERAMFLLRTTQRSVTDICLDVGSAASARSAGRSRRSSGNRPARTGVRRRLRSPCPTALP